MDVTENVELDTVFTGLAGHRLDTGHRPVGSAVVYHDTLQFTVRKRFALREDGPQTPFDPGLHVVNRNDNTNFHISFLLTVRSLNGPRYCAPPVHGYVR